jgi:hypothetical protein
MKKKVLFEIQIMEHIKTKDNNMKCAKCNSKEFHIETWKEQNKLAIPKIGVE